MKIAISATGRNMDSVLDMKFGRCEWFQMHDSESGEFEVVENTGLACNGGAGMAAAQQLIDENVDVIITGTLGPNVFEIIEKAGIKAYKCGNVSIQSVLEKCRNNELKEMAPASPAHDGTGR